MRVIHLCKTVRTSIDVVGPERAKEVGVAMARILNTHFGTSGTTHFMKK